MKKLFGKKNKVPTQPVPRTIAELKAAASELNTKLGEAQYLVEVYTVEVKRLTSYLREINGEAAARNELDAKEAKETQAPAAP